ncbi:hypothetical protein RCG23_22405 [Neobacillus sp. PS3-34]|uniref:hypothetical protein n=1 Tax=Neobacillus sp. PS3-34 TaxID=3070678 RepID=UPI0027E02E41|nr:hypothetical protein [Neobacillus sp. PS3-34]WML48013.1 hypothetical protein RCG23_22405 [Neobacillus sp. PS3-34]
METKSINEKYFRPSRLRALNTRNMNFEFFNPYFEKTYDEIFLPAELTVSPEDTIVNYYSILREAENLSAGMSGGCGTVGIARLPFPVAYNFLSKGYRRKWSYDQFLDSFKGIGHINLLKLHQVTGTQNAWRYFIEIETIEGSSKGVTFFAYYYGFINVVKENNHYLIDDIKLFGEDFLCAAYHGWDHDAESAVAVKYGNWCGMIKRMFPTQREGNVQNISFLGNDGHIYLLVYVELTNGTDLEVGQFRWDRQGKWFPISFKPEKCVEKKPIHPKL